MTTQMATQALGRHPRPGEPARGVQRTERAGSNSRVIETAHRALTPARASALALVAVVAFGLAYLRVVPRAVYGSVPPGAKGAT